MRAVLMGPPGAGKGTQAKFLAKDAAVPQIATGDILRKAREEGTPLGREAQSYMDRGDLVPDAVVIGLIEQRLSQQDAAQGFLLDGFPRTVPQAGALDRLLEEMSQPLHDVLLIEVPEEAIVHRLSGRRTCPSCGRAYHVETAPPPADGRCGSCGSELVTRPDDRLETVQARLKVYAESTAPLRDYYAARGLLRTVDGVGPVEEVTARLKAALRG
ncbi:MAG: adenylate kinase [Thermaerobacter sp.]|nr:adenylate kinase [Thermaerobacter sp.]